MFKEQNCGAHSGGGGLSVDSKLIADVCHIVERLQHLEHSLWRTPQSVTDTPPTEQDEVDKRRIQRLLERFRKYNHPRDPPGAMSTERVSGNSDMVAQQLSSVSTTRGSQLDTASSAMSSGATEDNPTDDQRTKECDREPLVISEEDIRALVRDLKRKIEYTESMNWLCLSKRPMGPPQRKSSIPKHTEVKKKFLEICDTALSDEVKAALRLPAFDSYEWEDADVLHLMQTMFLELGLVNHFNLPLVTLREWLYEVYKHYNDVPFHNFRHCFCVAQMMYAIIWQTDLFSRLGYLEILILLVSCICHDLDHPGYNNIYQINARTELALRYNDISPLENHHCSIAFRLLEHPDCNIFKNLSKDTFKEIREGIIRCILATDMARHNEIQAAFKDISPIFDYSNKAHTNLLCMVLIKVADISNEARPMEVAEPWLDRLLQEFFAQSAAEKNEGLPVTPFMDPDKISKNGSQVRFIGAVLLPLFEALGEILPELNDFIINPVRVALDYYKRLNDAQTRSRRSLVETENSSEGGSPPLPRSQSGMSMRSRRSIPSQKSNSRTSVDEPLCIAAELHDLPEGSESGDSETATEVEVAEKTSKFKVDTESSGRSKSTQTSKRQVSKEKRPSMCVEMYCNRMRGSYGNIHTHHPHRTPFGSNRAVSLDQYQNRRMSDGLQAVTSDTAVYYAHHQQQQLLQRHNLAMEHDAIAERAGEFTNGCGQTEKSKSLPAHEMRLGKMSGSSTQYHTNSVASGARNIISRLRQLTGRFGLSFDRDSKRLPPAGTAGSTMTTASVSPSKNNNAGTPKADGFCCNLSHRSVSPNLKCRGDVFLVNSSRNRAYSLDVPIKHRYSSSSSSRKSSASNKNDDDGAGATAGGRFQHEGTACVRLPETPPMASMGPNDTGGGGNPDNNNI
ncbi:high affinity cGMP-specific 3',5'-cyclic phosphodiesterase 9A [Lutzomyia longipalpis]|uniref:high affinity cGMP-specific 3',5'-cyclic phosphodiesterase 9A n=1 Tax=Lutzomyia longipalpis TaxID=7200 RepID=UPI002484540F|nr:high affinity cGMP-specific 3',5'-cyclic phosphodiesterase 9A [Lutzomyia longipalpis]XP_055676667.1 high affinity cGMP-specific 3',5'-cyclic phosphodiesterase 9A [Lutzomyia longipalpis]XP_055676668.1 high affinity cGMP-specific 3',5'-cyclic phosphodiesterase 9A [Lutzomyia longipalpis]XP_055676669.1 high affinity cGMP-specific 3',5'-cyclic phosphodiesterase 9A [Lutzomyia longipalpis]XP_055676670.1 high affinity cGMP-specific 3',5'-cyclic phosphodiesterase 9A [Lutzomyia longipalpis]